MVKKRELISILLSAFLGMMYAIFFVDKDPVLLIIFGLQILRSGTALRRVA